MRKNLAILALGAALSVVPMQKIYADDILESHKEHAPDYSFILDLINLNFAKRWELNDNLDLQAGIKIDINKVDEEEGYPLVHVDNTPFGDFGVTCSISIGFTYHL